MSKRRRSIPTILSTAIPCVPLFVPIERKAAWSGKWSCNWSVDAVKQHGGPWNTRDEACAAILATGLYRLRPGFENDPHFDRIA